MREKRRAPGHPKLRLALFLAKGGTTKEGHVTTHTHTLTLTFTRARAHAHTHSHSHTDTHARAGGTETGEGPAPRRPKYPANVAKGVGLAGRPSPPSPSSAERLRDATPTTRYRFPSLHCSLWAHADTFGGPRWNGPNMDVRLSEGCWQKRESPWSIVWLLMSGVG